MKKFRVEFNNGEVRRFDAWGLQWISEKTFALLNEDKAPFFWASIYSVKSVELAIV